MFKNLYDTPVEVEVSFSVSDTAIYRLPQGRMFTTYEIWTGTGKTGTQLIAGTDYIAAGESTFASTVKGESVYTGFQITNVGYHSTTLYATIYFVGTGGNIETKNMKAIETITATTYTIDDFGIDVYEVNNGECTVTLPDLARWQGREITVRAITDATTGISIEAAGSDVITRSDLTDVSLTSNGDFWVFFAGSTRWELMDGYETSGDSIRYPDSRQVSEGQVTKNNGLTTPQTFSFGFAFKSGTVPYGSLLQNDASSGSMALSGSLPTATQFSVVIYSSVGGGPTNSSRPVSYRYSGPWY